MSFAASLERSLPKPTYTGEDEEIAQHAQSRGVRIINGALADTQIVSRKSGGAPPYPRPGWRPKSQDLDFGDGGSYPEVFYAQFPLDMGRKGTSSSNTLAIQVTAEGKIDYTAISRRGHGDSRIVHGTFSDLIPLRQRADAGEVDLSRPSEEQIAATAEKTKAALDILVNGAVKAQKPKNVDVARREATYVRYTPSGSQMGKNDRKNDRIMKIMPRAVDPVAPPLWKHKKIPRGPPSPPAPVMHSPPRKLTAADQQAWTIPPPVSNWKNPKGYTVPLDKRLAADGRGLQDVTINDKFAHMSQALFEADRLARVEVKERALMQSRLAEKEKAQKEDHLRQLAQKAREERAGGGRRNSRTSRVSRSRSGSYSDSRSGSDSEDDEEVLERKKLREEKRRDEERKLRQSRMGAERRIQAMAREQNRDVSEKIALGIAKPTQSTETMFDSRLFNRTSGFDSGFNEDQAYDKPLFAAQDAISSIYRPRQNMDDDDGDDAAEAEMGKIQKSNRFGEALGRGTFKGTEDVEAREGPVQFEKDTGDAFANVDDFLKDVGEGAKKRDYGLQDEERPTKRARVDEDED